jgi:hypothetical protein
MNEEITWVRKDELVEDMPCGESVTTRYYDADGKIVRQDVEIRITKGLTMGSETGEIG